MTPKELKKIALAATKDEYEKVIKELKASAEQGAFSKRFSKLSDGVKDQLEIAGFVIEKVGLYYEVKFSKG